MNQLTNIIRIVFDLPFTIFLLCYSIYYFFKKYKQSTNKNGDFNVTFDVSSEEYLEFIQKTQPLKIHINLMVWFILYFFIFIF